MGRLPGFDYSRPFFYMVTLKRLPSAALRARAALRSRNRQYFTKARKIAFQGARYWAYGNEALLSLTGFGERWHPSAKQEKLCAEGRMLYLCPWESQEARLDKATMYKRAHHLVDWALEHTQERLEAWPI